MCQLRLRINSRLEKTARVETCMQTHSMLLLYIYMYLQLFEPLFSEGVLGIRSSNRKTIFWRQGRVLKKDLVLVRTVALSDLSWHDHWSYKEHLAPYYSVSERQAVKQTSLQRLFQNAAPPSCPFGPQRAKAGRFVWWTLAWSV